MNVTMEIWRQGRVHCNCFVRVHVCACACSCVCMLFFLNNRFYGFFLKWLSSHSLSSPPFLFFCLLLSFSLSFNKLYLSIILFSCRVLLQVLARSGGASPWRPGQAVQRPQERAHARQSASGKFQVRIQTLMLVTDHHGCEVNFTSVMPQLSGFIKTLSHLSTGAPGNRHSLASRVGFCHGPSWW